MELKDIIRTRRQELNLTLEDVARYVGVNAATVLRWESGEIKNLRRDKIAKLAAVLKVSPAYLMGWTDGELNPAPEIKISQEASKKLDALLAMVNELTDDEWSKLMDYCELLVFSRKNRKDE